MLQDGEESTTILVEWYATVLFWKPHVVLAVNETTLLPILMPLAPAATLPARIPHHIAEALAAYGAPAAVIDTELRTNSPLTPLAVLAPTAWRPARLIARQLRMSRKEEALDE